MGRLMRPGWTLCLCAMLMLALTAAGLTEPAGDFTYAPLDDGTAEITGWTGEGTALEIPSEIDGMSVTAIGANAFAGQALIESVRIPEGVAVLGDGAFADCHSLDEVHIAASVAQVGQNPFAGCENVRKLNLSEGQAYLSMINGVLFGDEGRRLIYCPRMLPMERYVMPEGVEAIDARAFSFCTKLLSVALPDSVTQIGNDAFEGHVNLTLVVGRDSYAEQYARENDIKYTYPDAADWLAE